MVRRPLFLGLDLSTQQLKASIIDSHEKLVCERAVHFDKDLPHYGTQNGAVRGDEDGEMTCPLDVWLESLDILMQAFVAAGVNLANIVAVSGAAQQHGSVYWTREAPSLLASLDPAKPLHEQLAPAAFSMPNAPIWQDSSTTAECRALEAAVGGPQALADMTGSRAYERFTGSQISKIYHRRPEVYAATHHISLVSSFLASLFLCRLAPIEVSDASGMNLMSIVTSQWDDTLLRACGGPELRHKLGEEPVQGGTILGNIGKWWVDRYGFKQGCIVAPFTGDNPASIVTLSSPGDAILSLGTSTTLLISIPPSPNSHPTCTTTSHLLAHPTAPGGSIAMLCYKNGGLTREVVRDKYANGSWDTFNSQVEARPAGNDGLLGFYFTLKEIIPDGVKGDYFFRSTASSSGQLIEEEVQVPEDTFPHEAHARAVLESQLLSIRSRLLSILPSDATADSESSSSEASSSTAPASAPAPATGLKRCIVTGGASTNPIFLQIIADILDLPVYIAGGSGGSAASGGCLLAKYAWWRRSKMRVKHNVRPALGILIAENLNIGTEDDVVGLGKSPKGGIALDESKYTFEEMRSRVGGLKVDKVAEPRAASRETYERMVDVYRRCEDMVVKST